jgi:hypothetical protein
LASDAFKGAVQGDLDNVLQQIRQEFGRVWGNL